VTFTPDTTRRRKMVQITGVNDDLPDGSQNTPFKDLARDERGHVYTASIRSSASAQRRRRHGRLSAHAAERLVTTSRAVKRRSRCLDPRAERRRRIPLQQRQADGRHRCPASLTFTSVTGWRRSRHGHGCQRRRRDGAQTYHGSSRALRRAWTRANDKLDPTTRPSPSDNDTAGVTLSPETGLVTFENGAMTTFGIALNSPPSKDVSIVLSSSNEAEAPFSPPSVTFTSLNWMAPQVVTVTGVDDTRADGNQPYRFVTSPAKRRPRLLGSRWGPDAQLINRRRRQPGLASPRPSAW